MCVYTHALCIKLRYFRAEDLSLEPGAQHLQVVQFGVVNSTSLCPTLKIQLPFTLWTHIAFEKMPNFPPNLFLYWWTCDSKYVSHCYLKMSAEMRTNSQQEKAAIVWLEMDSELTINK